jgi:hypothetical protein
MASFEDIASTADADLPPGDAPLLTQLRRDAACAATPDDVAVCPAPQPSRQHVRFHLRGGPPWYVVARGNHCDGMAIERASGVGVVGFRSPPVSHCGVQETGGAVPNMDVSALRRDDAEGLVMEWDALDIVGCSTWMVCGGCAYEAARGVPRQTPPGRYRAWFGFVSALPASCFPLADQYLRCPLAARLEHGPIDAVWFCGGTRLVSVEFELPADRDVDVDVPVP